MGREAAREDEKREGTKESEGADQETHCPNCSSLGIRNWGRDTHEPEMLWLEDGEQP